MELVTRAVVACVVLSMSTTVSAEAPPSYHGGKISASLLGQPTSIDPLEATRHADTTIVRMVFDSLYRVDQSGRVRPHLAAGMPELSNGGRTVRIPVRSGVRFHDGSVLRAADVVLSLRRLLRSRRAGWMLGAVKSVDESSTGVVMHLRRADADLARILSAPSTSITKRGKAPSWSRPVGSGPFRLRKRSARRVQLAAFDKHFAGRPYIDSIELAWHSRPDKDARTFELGHSHASLRGPVAFVGHVPKYAATALATEPVVLAFLGFGDALPRSRDFGRAISLAIDRRAFLGIGSGEKVLPTTTIVTPGNGRTPRPPGARLARARRALKAARRAPRLQRRLSDGRPLEILVDASRPDDREVADRIMASLFKLKVSARVVSLASEEFARRVGKGDCELFVDHLVSPVAEHRFEAAAAIAAAEPGWVRSTIRQKSPTAATMKVRLRDQQRIVPLFHRAVRIHYRSNLYGLEASSSGLIDYHGVFVHGKPKKSRRQRR